MSTGLLPPPNPAYTPGLQLLGVYSASAGASIDIVSRNQGGLTGPIFQSDFDIYEFALIDIIPATTATNLLWRASTNGGVSYDSAANYGYVGDVRGVGGLGSFGVASATFGALNKLDNMVNTATKPITGTVRLYDPLNASLHKVLAGNIFYWDTTSVVEGIFSSGYNSATPVNACQFFMNDSGGTVRNITGTILVYGKAKSAIIGVPLVITPGMMQIQQIVAAGSPTTIDFQNIPQIYTSLKVVSSSQDTSAGTSLSTLRVRFNNDTTAGNYTATARMGAANGGFFSANIAASALGVALALHPQSGNTNMASDCETIIANYTNSAWHKRVITVSGTDAITDGVCITTYSARWKSTAPITRVTFGTDGTAFTNGSIFTLYGIL